MASSPPRAEGLVPEIHVARAVRVLAAGGVIAYPTEGVYGLGCLPGERRAVERLLRIKRRSWRKGLALVAASLAQLEPLIVLPAGPSAQAILATWPGPVTWVLEARSQVPPWLTGGRATLAVRVSAHPIVRALCERAGGALVSTSANLSARPPLTRLLLVRRELGRRVDYVLAGPLGGLEGPTEIRDGRTGEVLRG